MFCHEDILQYLAATGMWNSSIKYTNRLLCSNSDSVTSESQWTAFHISPTNATTYIIIPHLKIISCDWLTQQLPIIMSTERCYGHRCQVEAKVECWWRLACTCTLLVGWHCLSRHHCTCKMCGKSTQNMADGLLQHNMEFLIKLDSTLGKELLHSMTKGEEW